jgi:hypothetical protein
MYLILRKNEVILKKHPGHTTITILDIIHHPVFYLKLNPTVFARTSRKHITRLLRAQQANAIYRFVTMVN